MKQKKLNIARETLRRLNAARMEAVWGAYDTDATLDCTINTCGCTVGCTADGCTSGPECQTMRC